MSRVSSGEVVENTKTGDLYTYPGKPNNNDNLIDRTVNPGDEKRIFSNNLLGIEYVRNLSSKQQKQKNLAKNSNSSLAKQTEQLQKKVISRALQPFREMQDQMAIDSGNYAGGKPSNLLGIPSWARAIPPAMGLGASIDQMLRWKRQDIKEPVTYVPNPYGRQALGALSNMQNDEYNQLRSVYDAERRGIAEMNRAGGATGAQKYLQNVALNLGTQRNLANVIAANAENRNKNIAAWANAAASIGQHDAANMQNSNQFGRQDYVEAHGRKVKGYETAIANGLQQMQSALQNEFKYRMGNMSLAMYLQQLDNEQKELAMKYANRVNGTQNTPTESKSPSVQKSNKAVVNTTQPMGASQNRFPYVYNWNYIPPVYNVQPTQYSFDRFYTPIKSWNNLFRLS